MGHDARKPVFGVSDQVMPKIARSAIETFKICEISLVASFDIILANKRMTKAWSDCAGAQTGLRLCCSQTTEDRFSRFEAKLYNGHRLYLVTEFIIRGVSHSANVISLAIGIITLLSVYNLSLAISLHLTGILLVHWQCDWWWCILYWALPYY